MFAARTEAKAASSDIFRFTKVGTTHYSVRLADDTVTTAVIPETYNGLPVKEIAASGFAYSENLERVYIPETVTTVKRAAFNGCESLKVLQLNSVETVEQNAFAGCTSLEKVFVPDTVSSMGANVLRNSAPTVYVEKPYEETLNWTNWLSGFGGSPEDVKYDHSEIVYDEVYDSDGAVAGYSLLDASSVKEPDLDLVLDYHGEDGGESELPIVEIQYGAFNRSQMNTLSVGVRSSHTVKIQSNAFARSAINGIWLGGGVVFADVDESTGEEIPATDVFFRSDVSSVVLPSSVDTIEAGMFMETYNLQSVGFVGLPVSSKLPASITAIGENAFAYSALPELEISSETVTSVGYGVCLGWTEEQIVKVDFYADARPLGWDEYWYEGDGSPVYRRGVNIMFDFMGGSGSVEVVEAVPGDSLPPLEKPVRTGYNFEGYWDNIDGQGTLYYDKNMNGVAECPQEDITLYAYWTQREYLVRYMPNRPDGASAQVEGVMFDLRCRYDSECNLNKNEFTLTGWKFVGWKDEQDNFYPDEHPVMNLTADEEEVLLYAQWELEVYNITYRLGFGSNSPENPSTYTYETPTVILAAPIRLGYFCSWNVDRIPKNSMGDIIVIANYVEKTIEQCYNTREKLYEIATVNQFDAIRTFPNGAKDLTFKLLRDVDSYSDGRIVWIPIPEFRGVLDGNGFSFWSFELLEHTGCVGLFAENYGTIKNFEVAGRIRAVDNSYCGMLVGANFGLIENCSVDRSFNTPNISSVTYTETVVGGLVGINFGKIKNCRVEVELYGSGDLGGIAGYNYGEITDSTYAYCEIEYYYYGYNGSIGGIVGRQYDGIVRNCRVEYASVRTNTSSDCCNPRDTEMQFNMGIVIGFLSGGSVSGNGWIPPSPYKQNVFAMIFLNEDVVYEENGVTKHHNQALYVKNEECGRIS